MATFGIKSVISLVDNFTSPLDRVNKKINQSLKPLQQLHNKTRNLKKALGFQTVGRALTNVVRGVGGVANSLKNLTTKATLVGGLVAGVMFGMAATTANAGDAAIKAAQKVGISTPAWTELAYAADMSGVSAESLKSGMTRLNKSITAAAQGNKQAMYWFNGLGISIRDQNGSLKSADVMLAEVADKLALMKDGSLKSRVAAELFGQSVGPDLIPLLNTGKEGIQAMRAEAIRLGITFSEEQGKAAEDFNDSLARIKYALRGVTHSIGNELIPIFSDLFKDVENIIVANRQLVAGKVREWIGKLRDTLPELKLRLMEVWASIQSLGKKISAVVEYLGGWERALTIVGVALVALNLAPLIVSVIALTKAVFSLGVAFLTTPIGWVVIGIAALVAGIMYLWNNCEGFRNFWISLWDKVAGAVSEKIERIKSAFDKGLLQGLWAVFAEFNPLTLMTECLDGLFSFIFNFSLVDAGVKVIHSLLDGLKSAWSSVTGWFSKKIKELINDYIPGFMRGVFGLDSEEPAASDSVAAPQTSVQAPSDAVWGGDQGLGLPQPAFPGPVPDGSHEGPAFGPPAGAREMQQREIVNRSESTRDAKVTVDFNNVPSGATVKTQGVDQTHVRKDPMTFGYAGPRMGL